MNKCSLIRELPVFAEYDVVVTGSGPAGICAAVSSARKGASTALIERYGVIGGNLIAGHVGPIMGGVSKGTIRDEVVNMLDTKAHSVGFDIEMAKITLTEWINNNGVKLYLQCPVVDVLEENGSIQGLVVGTKSGICVIKAKVFVDATGDGTVAYLAKADYKVGRDQDGLMQPTTHMFTVSNVNEESAITCFHEADNPQVPLGRYLDLCEKASREGELPENVTIVRLYYGRRPGERIVNASQANYINGLDMADITKAEIDLYNQTKMIVAFLKKYAPGFENCYISNSADTLGIRETRRVTGEYVLQDRDLLEGRRFDDVMVHKADFVVDIHNPDGGGQAEGVLPEKVKPYDIPYRCFVPLKVENLLTVGRCISGTHRAHASYRVMSICMAMGQAVGIAAALSSSKGISPRKLDYKEIQQELMNLGVDLYS